jgi:hypothetical protein
MKWVAKAGFLLVAATAMVSESERDNTGVDLLKTATRLFQHASDRTENRIPDGVLNRTKCVVLIAALSRASSNRSGVLACRDTLQRWTNPELITFTEARRAPNADLIVLILQDQALRSLRSSGRLHIRDDDPASSPFVSSAKLPKPAAVGSKLLVYQHAADRLSAVDTPIDGVIGDRRSKPELPAKGRADFLAAIEAYFNTIRPTGIVLHHTATIPSENALPRNAREVDEFHQQRGFEIKCSGRVYHEAYHFLIFPNGHVKKGRPENCEGAHAEGYNSYLGISLVGDFSSKDNPRGEKGATKPSQKQIDSLVRLCRRLRERYKFPLNHIMRHSEISHTACPGNRFPFTSVLQQIETSK